MNLRTKVGAMRLVLAKEVHAREGRNAERRNLPAEKYARLDAHGSLLSRVDFELIRPS